MAPPGGPAAGGPFADHLGLRFGEPGVVSIEIGPHVINTIGVLLGPVGFALVDYAMGAAVWAQLADDERTATINVAINFVDSAREGEVTCRARVDRRTRRAAATSAEVRHADGRLLMTAVGSFAIMLPRR
jgi:uncharacterized protein (TIGR00369 family)